MHRVGDKIAVSGGEPPSAAFRPYLSRSRPPLYALDDDDHQHAELPTPMLETPTTIEPEPEYAIAAPEPEYAIAAPEPENAIAAPEPEFNQLERDENQVLSQRQTAEPGRRQLGAGGVRAPPTGSRSTARRGSAFKCCARPAASS